jgi:small subunit ribosomal protein S17e
MGRIKTTPIKRATQAIFEKGKSEFTNDFNENKKILEKYAEFQSKKIRNVVAGYLTRLNKTKDDF